MKSLTVRIAADAVARLGVAGHPLSPKALAVLIALTDDAPNGAEDVERPLDAAWVRRRCGSAQGPMSAQVLARQLRDLHHAGLISRTAHRGRTPRVSITPPGKPFTAVPVALLWSSKAASGDPLRPGALESIVALLTILPGCDWDTPVSGRGRAALAGLSARRNAYTGAVTVEEVQASRAELQRLAGAAITWTRPAYKKGLGPYHVIYDWGLLPPLQTQRDDASNTAAPAPPPVPIRSHDVQPQPDEDIYAFMGLDPDHLPERPTHQESA